MVREVEKLPAERSDVVKKYIPNVDKNREVEVEASVS